MAELKFDPKKGQEAAEALISFCNGAAQDSLVELFGIVKSMGEGNPIVDAPIAALKKVEQYFNEEFVPHANAIKDHFMEYSELSALIINTQAASVKDGEGMGSVQETTYNAAKKL